MAHAPRPFEALANLLTRPATTPTYRAVTRRTTPKSSDALGGLFRTWDGPNGHVYKRFTKHEDHRELPTQKYYKCVKCSLYVCGTPYGRNTTRSAFLDRCREQTCLEYAYREFRTGNSVRGADRIEQVCDAEGLVEPHQFAEGIGIPTPRDA